MKTRVHISIEVADLKRSIIFYQHLFQTDATKIRSDYANFRLDTPALHLALVHSAKRQPIAERERPSNQHFGVELFSEDHLSSWLEKATTSGMTPRIEKDVTCCYATANKFWVRDPDGHQWEFWVRSGEAQSMHAPEQTKAQQPACCAPGQC